MGTDKAARRPAARTANVSHVLLLLGAVAATLVALGLAVAPGAVAAADAANTTTAPVTPTAPTTNANDDDDEYEAETGGSDNGDGGGEEPPNSTGGTPIIWDCRVSENPSARSRGISESIARAVSTTTPARKFPASGVVTIGVAFHILYKRDGTGKISNGDIADQIAQLNKAFAGNEARDAPDTRIRFVSAGVDFIQDDDMFDSCGPYNSLQRKYADSPGTIINVYTCNIPFVIGSTTMPASVYDDNWNLLPESDPHYGILLHYQSFSGGTLANLNTGDVLTHEVGHFLGLSHPYQDACAAGGQNDFILDTPRMAQNVRGSCAANRGKHSCKSIPNANALYTRMPNPPDDISNYMVSTDDSCRDHFTPGQAAFMQQTIALYKPDMLTRSSNNNNNNPSSPPAPTPSQRNGAPSPAPTTKTPGGSGNDNAQCTWTVQPNVAGAPVQRAVPCQLPFRIGRKKYTAPISADTYVPFGWAGLDSPPANAVWCPIAGTRKYAKRGATKARWGLAECV